jgi:acyl carrier protein
VHTYEEVSSVVKEMIVSIRSLDIDPARLDEDQSIYDEDGSTIAMDSLDAVELLIGLSTHFDVTIEDDIDPDAFRSIRLITESLLIRLPDREATSA